MTPSSGGDRDSGIRITSRQSTHQPLAERRGIGSALQGFARHPFLEGVLHMNRRSWMQWMGLGVGAGGLGVLTSSMPRPAVGRTPDQEQEAVSRREAPLPREQPKLKITDVKTILTAPAGIRLIVVKVLTSEAGLYGLGCATFTQRARVVEPAIDRYLRPFLIGKDPLRIEDLWQSMFVSSYWRNGPVLYNAMSGVDMACWDILGKLTKQPVYQLLGGKCREAVDTYRHTSGTTFRQV